MFLVTATNTAIATINHNDSIATSDKTWSKSAATKSAATSKSKHGRGQSKAASIAAQPYPTAAIWEKYRDWNVQRFRSALARAVDAELKVLNGQTMAGEITIPGGTLHRRINKTKAGGAQKGEESVLYLDNFKRAKEGEKGKMLTDKANNT